jgi:hypothetical protein
MRIRRDFMLCASDITLNWEMRASKSLSRF